MRELPLDAIGPYLSERTLDHYRTLDLQRNVAEVCARSVLTKLLEAARIEPSDALLGFEERWGGVQIGDCFWGIYARVVRGLPLIEIAGPGGAKIVRVGSALTVEDDFYLDHRGALYEEPSQLGIVPTRIADAWPTYFERAFTAGSIQASRPFRLEIGAAVGASMARLFEVPPLPEGTDTYASIWLRDDIEVYEQRSDVLSPQRGPRTIVVTAKLDDIARALLALVSPTTPVSLRLRRAVSDAHLPPGKPVWRVPIEGRRELRVYGRSEAFRVWVGVPPADHS